MRRLFVIAAALGLMYVLEAAQGPNQSNAGMALASIGFVVLAAFTFGDLVNAVGLPRITGYIISGIVLGPEIIGVLSQPVVDDMGVFNTLALGLIALSAGLEIEVAAMRRVMRTMAAIIVATLVLLLVVVGGGLFLAHRYLLPLPVDGDNKALLLCALIAVLGTATSPSITLAMVRETKARGRLTDIALGLAVLNAVVVIVVLAVTIGIGRDAISPGASGGIAPVIQEMAERLGLSIAVGAAVGVLLILYVKYIHRELLLGAVVAVLLTAEVSTHLNLELLLVLITTGFVIRNFSDQEHHLLPSLQRVSLPVFVVFFTTAGARVDLEATVSVLPFAGGAAVGRALVYYVSTRFGVWVGREGPAIRKHGWYGFIPQAGVTLGLTILASQQVPELHDQILRIGLAIIAIHLLVGPVLLGTALGRAGEIPGRAAPKPTRRTGPVAIVSAPDAPRMRELPALSDARLKEALARFGGDLERWVAHMREQVLAPLADRGKAAIARIFSEHKKHDSTAAAVRTMLETAAADPSDGLEQQLRTAHVEACALTERLPERLKVVTERKLLGLALRDGLFVTASKIGKRLARLVWLKPKRTVPVRLAARYASEERLAEALANVLPSWFDARGEMLAELARLVNDETDVETATQAIVRRANQFTEAAATDLQLAVADVIEILHDQLASLGGPGFPPARLGLFEMEERIAQLLGELDAVGDRGRKVLRGRMTTLHADALYAYVAATLDDELELMVRRPQGTVAQEIVPTIRTLADRLPGPDDWGTLQATSGDRDPIVVLSESLEQAYDEHAAARLRGLQLKYYHATQESQLLTRLATRLEGLPARLVVVDRHARVEATHDLPLVTLEPARRLEEELIEGFAPELLAAMRPFGDLVSAIDAQINQALSVATRGIEQAGAGTLESRLQAAREPVARAKKLLQGMLDDLASAGEAATAAAAKVVDGTRAHVAVALGKASPESSRAHPSRQRWRWWSRILDRVVRRGTQVRRRVEAFARSVLRRTDVREWIIRTGNAKLDAVAMREYVARHHAAIETLPLPAAYKELVSAAPIEDVRLATARRAQLDALVASLQPGDTEDFTSVLISGERGSGRTSMINVLGHRLARRRVIRIDARYHARRGGPLAAMAAELGAAGDEAALASALRKAPAIVLLDDLERFLGLSPAGIEDLARFLRLVRATAAHTHWVVTAQTATVELVDPFVHISETFGRRLELAPLAPEELDQVVQARIQFSGLEVRCVDGSRRTRLRPKEAHRRYVHALARIARGNLRRAVLIHARSTAPDGGGFVAREPHAPGVPFLRHLGAGPLAALALVTRYVELSAEDLAEGLAVPASEIDRFVLPLRSAGLLEATAGRSTLAVPPHLVDAVCSGLSELGLRPRGAV
ncbi:MAG: cation:proton antiporter [Acidobacteriota bacterium]